MMLRQLRVMLWKNALSRMYHWPSTLFDLLVPMLFMFLLVWIKSLTTVYDSPNIAYTCGQTPPWFYSQDIDILSPQKTELLSCLQMPEECRAENYYRNGFNTTALGAPINVGTLYTQNGYVSAGKHYPFYALTVGDTSNLYDEFNNIIEPVLPDVFGTGESAWNPSLPLAKIGSHLSHHRRLLAICAKNLGDPGLDFAVKLLEEQLQGLLGFSNVVHRFDSEQELEDYILDSQYENDDYRYGKVAMAVVLNKVNLASHQWDYTLRTNSSFLSIGQRSVDCLYGNCRYAYSAPPTIFKTVPLQQPVLADFLYGYSYSGFLSVQKAIDEFVLSLSSGRPVHVVASYGLFPTAAFKMDEFKLVIASTLGIFYMLAYILPVSRMIRVLVLEKELRIKEGLQMMGLTSFSYAASHYITMVIQILVTSGLMIAVTATNVFKYSDSGLIFLYFTAFGIAIISLCFLLSTFFSRSKTAATLGTVIFFALFFPYFPAAALNWGRTAKTWVCLCAPACFALGADVVAEYEGGLVGVQRSNTGEEVKYFSYDICVGMLFVDAILYAALAWYFGKVFPSEFGVREHWNFLLKPAFWRHLAGRSRNKGINEFLEPLLQEVEEGSDAGWGDTFERPSPELLQQVEKRSCVEIRNLKKSYGKTKDAVKGMTLDIFEGQITVLLGHNGAGKSTTINMLTGMVPVTSGEVLMRGHRLTKDLSSVRSFLGVCPQHDILIPELTPVHHLTIVATLKGYPAKEIKAEVERMLKKVGLSEKANNQCSTLSGGQKRKISVAMALIGDSKIIILDEPTSGMDPYSRRYTWDLLQRSRKGRVILLTTHFMDEADILGDRIAIMTEGELKCCGSSLFLKSRYGVGYTLSIVRDLQGSNQEQETKRPDRRAPSARVLISFVKQYLSDADILSMVGSELSFRVPFSASSFFPALFDQLEENRLDLGVRSFGVSVTTLEEVFMKVADGDVDAVSVKSSSLKTATPPGSPSLLAKIKTLKKAQSLDELDKKNLSEVPKMILPFSLNSDTSSAKVSYDPKVFSQDSSRRNSDTDFRTVSSTEREDSIDGRGSMNRNPHCTFAVHFKALILKRYRCAKRDKKNVCFQLVIPTLLVLLGLSLSKITNNFSQPELILSPGMFNPTYPDSEKNFVPIQEDSEFGAALRAQFSGNSDNLANGVFGVAVDIDTESIRLQDQFSGCARGAEPLLEMSNYLLASQDSNLRPSEKGSSRYGAVTFATLDHQADPLDPFAYNILVNASAVHAAPIYMNLVHEAALKVITNGTGYIKTSTHPLPLTLSQKKAVQAVDAFSAAIQIMVAFCFIPAAYAIFVVREREVKAKHQQTVSGVAPFVYWISTFAWDVASYIVPSGITIILIFAFEITSYTTGWGAGMMFLLVFAYGPATAALTYCLSFFFQSHSSAQNMTLFFNFLTGLALMITSFVLSLINSTREVNMKLKYFYRLFPGFCLGDGLLQLALCDKGTCPKLTSTGFTLMETLSPYSWDVCGANLCYLLLEAVVYFLICLLIEHLQNFPKLAMLFQHVKNPDDDPEEEDEDVLKEAQRVLCGGAENDAVRLYNLRKVYPTPYGPKVAVKKLTFGIPKGECFGFLGMNGAGKTTTLSILCGEFQPTSGTALITGFDVMKDASLARRKIGFCPQFDALLELLTVSEHLEFYAHIKGVPAQHVQKAVEEKLAQMDLWPFAHHTAGTLSGGNKRKLSVAVALIGNPTIVVLDEPSTGMDPVARRFMWDRISKVLQEDKNCCVILTTHSMEEAEALSGRIGIMVNGALQCLGTSQHLKSRFGQGFEVDVKLEPPSSENISTLANTVRTGFDRSNILKPPFSSLCVFLGRPDRVDQICEKGSGSILWDVTRSEGQLPVRLFCEWWIAEDRSENFGAFLTENFKGVMLIERSTLFSMRYRIDYQQSMSLSSVFRIFESQKAAFQVSEYSIGQTTLEQIFNDFASRQNNPEHRMLSSVQPPKKAASL